MNKFDRLAALMMPGEHQHIKFDLVKHDHIINGKNWWLGYMITTDGQCPFSSHHNLTDEELEQLKSVVNNLKPREIDNIDKYKKEHKIYVAKECKKVVSDVEKEVNVKLSALDSLKKEIENREKSLRLYLRGQQYYKKKKSEV